MQLTCSFEVIAACCVFKIVKIITEDKKVKIITEMNLKWKAWFSIMCLQRSLQKQCFDRKLLLSAFTGHGEC